MDNKEYLDLSVHEIKNILSAISGYSEFISNKMVDGDKIFEFAEKIRGLSDILAGYADKKYMYEILHNHLHETKMEPVLLCNELENAKKRLEESEQRKLNFQINCCSDIEIYTDKILLEELFDVIMENALRYSTEEGVAEIAAENLENETVVSIKNRAEEIMEEELEKLTEPYYRIDKAASRKMGGQGFGLAIADEIMKLQNGKIHIMYKEGYITVTLHFENERRN